MKATVAQAATKATVEAACQGRMQEADTEPVSPSRRQIRPQEEAIEQADTA